MAASGADEFIVSSHLCGLSKTLHVPTEASLFSRRVTYISFWRTLRRGFRNSRVWRLSRGPKRVHVSPKARLACDIFGEHAGSSRRGVGAAFGQVAATLVARTQVTETASDEDDRQGSGKPQDTRFIVGTVQSPNLRLETTELRVSKTNRSILTTGRGARLGSRGTTSNSGREFRWIFENGRDESRGGDDQWLKRRAFCGSSGHDQSSKSGTRNVP